MLQPPAIVLEVAKDPKKVSELWKRHWYHYHSTTVVVRRKWYKDEYITVEALLHEVASTSSGSTGSQGSGNVLTYVIDALEQEQLLEKVKVPPPPSHQKIVNKVCSYPLKSLKFSKVCCWRGVFTRVECDAVVVSSNFNLLPNSQQSILLHDAAGDALRRECTAIGPLETGSCVVTCG